MEKQKIGIQKFLIKHLVVVTFFSFGLLTSIWILNEYLIFSSESASLREEYLDSQRAILKSEVTNVVDYVKYMKVQTEKRLKSELKGRVYEAIDIGTNIYQENMASKSPDEIGKMVKDALRPIRFLNDRGYYFAFSMDGIETLFADRPEMEGVNMLPVQGAAGEYVVKDMIAIVKKQQEGFYQYTWTKPFQKRKGFSKIAYVKYFKPLDWAIGTGEYVDDFTSQIQDIVLDRIVGQRFGEEGYFFGSMDGGHPLFTNGEITRGSDHIWNLTDPDGVKIIQEQQKASKNPEGGFVQYTWKKLGSPDPSPKISFVRGIPGWGWAIGAGVYLDSVEKIIAEKKDALRSALIKKIIASMCVFAVLLVLIWFWTRHVAAQTRKSMKTFESFFERATTEFVTIPANEMQFLELSRIAVSANKMIKALKLSENTLRDREETFRALFEQASIGIAEVDTKTGRIIRINQKYCDIVGYPLAEMITMTYIQITHPDDRQADLDGVRRIGEGKIRIYTREKRYIQKNGAIVWVQLTLSPIGGRTDPSARHIEVVEDITERKQLESRLQQSQKMESIGALAGGIAHDFNNILFPIIGMSELLLEDLPSDSLEYENASEILRAGKRGGDLVKQILAFSRRSEHKMIPVRVQQTLKEILKLGRSTIPSNIEILQNIQTDCGLVTADPTQLHQVVMNLITNAYHAVEPSGGKISVQLRETALGPNDLTGSPLEPGRYALLTISDTGCGIAPAIMDKIFEPYFTTKEQGKGTGLGLAVVYGIVREHNGDIKVYSEVGKGTTFNLYFPLLEKSSEPEIADKVEIHQTGDERILLVDDEEPIARLGNQMLGRLGYRVTYRTSSVEALKAFAAHPEAFDLVITDMTMPNMTGDQLAKELISIRPAIPIIICTGFSERINREKAEAMGIKAFLMKPVVKSEMAQTVRKVLDEDRRVRGI
jgi:PAS domain S-box-containing protein